MYSVPDQLFQTYNVGLLTLYNKTLENTIGNMTELSNVVRVLSDNINRINNSVVRNFIVQNQSARSEVLDGPQIASQEGILSLGQAKPTLSEMGKYIELAKAIGTTAKSTVELGEVSGVTAELAAKVKPFVKGGNALIDALGGVQKFVAATETVAEATAVAEVITASLNAGEAASVAGPYAAIATALSVLVVSSIVSSIIKNVSAESRVSSFLDEGLKTGNPYFVALQHSKNSANDMVVHARQETSPELGKRSNAIITELLKQKGDPLFESDRAANDEVYTSAFLAFLDRMDTKKGGIKKGVVFEDKADMKKFTEFFDPFNHYNKSVMPSVGAPSSDLPSGEGVTGYITYKQDKQNRKNRGITGGVAMNVWENAALQTMKNMYVVHNLKFVEDERERQLRQYGHIPGYKAESDKVLKLFVRMIPEIDREKKGINSNTVSVRKPSVGPSLPTGNTINFNKALIEHFTINVKDSKEGMNDFKRKVEEVLIEILHSVNTIH